MHKFFSIIFTVIDNKLYRYIIFTFLLIFVIVLTIPSLINYTKFESKIIADLKKISGQKVEIRSIKAEPSAISNLVTIIIKDINFFDDNSKPENSSLKIGEAKFSIELSSLFSVKEELTINKLEINDTQLFLQHSLDKELFIQKLASLITSEFSGKPKLLVSKAFSIKTNQISSKTDFNQIYDFELDLSQEKNFSLSGRFSGQTSKVLDFSFNAMQKKDSKQLFFNSQINYDNNNLDFNGELDLQPQLLINVNAKLRINRPEFIFNLFSTTFPFLVHYSKNNLSDVINVSGKVIYKNHLLKLDDLNIKANFIESKGSFTVNNTKSPLIEINLVTNKLDFNEFSRSQIINEDTNTLKVYTDDNDKNILKEFINLDFLNIYNFKLDYIANNIIFNNITINDLSSQVEILNNKVVNSEVKFNAVNNQFTTNVLFKNLQINQMNNSNYFMGDFFSQGNNINNTISLFGGQEYFQFKDANLNYKLTSRVIIAPNEVSLFKITGSLGDKGNFSGIIATRLPENIANISPDDYQANKYQNNVIALKFDQLQLSNIETPLLTERANILLTQSKDSNYLVNFRWFRILKQNFNINLNFANTKFADQNLNNLNLNCILQPGSIRIRSKIDAEFAKADLDLLLSAESIKPVLNLTVNSDRLNLSKFLLLLDNFRADKTIKSQDWFDSIKRDWNDQELTIFRIDKFNAKYNFNFKNFTYQNTNFNEINLQGKTKNNVLYIDKFRSVINDGVLELKGNISFFDHLLYQASFNSTNIDLDKLISNFFPKRSRLLVGKLGITGILASEGNSIKEIMRAMSINAIFATQALTLNNISVDEIIDLALKRKFIQQKEVLKTIDHLLTFGSTYLLNIKGELKGSNGLFSINGANFQTRFSSGLFFLNFGLNDLSISSATQIAFLPYFGNSEITYEIEQNGYADSSLETKYNTINLVKYVKKEFRIITEQDLIEARRKLEIEKRKKGLIIDDNNDQDFIYHKIIQKDLAKEEAEIK